MGQGYGCTCNKCGYSFSANLGVGFLFPMVYRETVGAMKKGEYGEQGKKFFDEHSDGAIDCETVVARCSACGEYGLVPALTMYVPKKDFDTAKMEPKGRWSVAFPCEGAEYVSWLDLKKYYDLYEKYDHRCPECGGAAEIVEDFEKKLEEGELSCAKCDGTLKLADIIMWD